MHAKSGGSSGEPPDFLFIPAACRSRKDLPRSAGGGDRARNAGYRLRNAEDGGTGTGRRRRGCGATGTERRAAGPRVRVRVRDAEHGRRGRGARDAGRKTRNTWTRTRTRARARGHGVQDAGRRTQNTGYWPRAAEHGKRGHEVQKTEDAGTKCRRRKTRARGAGRRTRATGRGQQNTGNAGTGRRRRGIGDGAQAPVHGPQRDCIHPPSPATTCRDRSQPGAIRRRDQSAGTFHGWTPAAGTRNNPPGPFTAGRHPPPGPIRRDLSRLDARRPAPQQPAGAVHSRAPSAAAAATCRAYESESRRCHRARRTCCCRAAPRPT